MLNKKAISNKEALLRAMQLCSVKENCKHDIKEKLLQWGLIETDIEIIISKLVKNDFINEKRYAKFYVRDKYRFNKWGRIKIKYQLIQKHIPEELILSAYNEIDEKEYNKILVNELSKKLKTLKSNNKYDAKVKLVRYAVSKGFESELILKTIENIIKI